MGRADTPVYIHTYLTHNEGIEGIESLVRFTFLHTLNSGKS